MTTKVYMHTHKPQQCTYTDTTSILHAQHIYHSKPYQRSNAQVHHTTNLTPSHIRAHTHNTDTTLNNNIKKNQCRPPFQKPIQKKKKKKKKKRHRFELETTNKSKSGVHTASTTLPYRNGFANVVKL